MDIKNRSNHLWQALLDWASRACNANEKQISQSMGRSKDFVSYAKRHRKKGATLEEAVGLMTAIGLPDWAIFRRLFPLPEPAELLRSLGQAVAEKSGGDHAAPRLLQHAERISLAQSEKDLCPAEAPPRSHRHQLIWIEDLRLEDPVAAQRFLDDAIEELLVVLLNTQSRQPEVLGDLAFAVALWGDFRRSEGSRALALVACPLALALAERSREKWAIAHALWKAALLAHDLGFADFALPWLDRAAFLFSLDRHYLRLPELLVTEGILALASGRRERGIEALRDALAGLPVADRRWRHPALLHLATASLEAGRQLDASGCLEILSREHQSADHLQGIVQWHKAAIQLAMGETSEGLFTFACSLRLLAEFGERESVGVAICDLADFLVNQGHQARIGALIAEVLVFFDRGGDPLLAELMEDLFAMSRLRPLTSADIDRTRSRLRQLSQGPKTAFPALWPSSAYPLLNS